MADQRFLDVVERLLRLADLALLDLRGERHQQAAEQQGDYEQGHRHLYDREPHEPQPDAWLKLDRGVVLVHGQRFRLTDDEDAVAVVERRGRDRVSIIVIIAVFAIFEVTGDGGEGCRRPAAGRTARVASRHDQEHIGGAGGDDGWSADRGGRRRALGSDGAARVGYRQRSGRTGGAGDPRELQYAARH